MKQKIIINNLPKKIKISKNFIRDYIKLILDNEKVITNEVIVNFVSKKAIKDLHKIFFNDPTSTDCISFPIDKPYEKKFYHLLGEVFVCTQEAIEYAKRENADPKKELLLYVTHTILHLIGYDDINKKDISIMRKKEKFYMDKLKTT